MGIGIGSGVISAVMLLRRAIRRVIGTDIHADAIDCARENLQRLGLLEQVQLIQTNLFDDVKEQADLIVCNPPWIPGTPHSTLDQAVYDDNHMLRNFLLQAQFYLKPDGEVWLILSNAAQLLGLRTQEQLLQMIEDGNLQVHHVLQTKPTHPKATKKLHHEFDAISAARQAEITS